MESSNIRRQPQVAPLGTGAATDGCPAVEPQAWWAIFERSGWGFAIGDPDGTFVAMNPAYAEMHGYLVEELVGRPIATVLTQEGRQQVPELMRAAHESGHLSLEQVHERKDGTTFPVQADVVVAKDADGRVLYRAAWAQDISERKQAEAALQESEIILRATLEATADGILVLDNNSQILHVNERFAELWRIPKELLAAGDAKKLHHCVVDQVKHPEAFVSRVNELYETPEEALDTLSLKDGRVYERLSRPLMRGGQIAGRVWSFRDITERKQAEEALRQARELLEGRVERQMVRRNPYRLTFREFTVLHLVTAGRADKEIALELGISPLTVHKHVANILGKMNAASRTEASVRALREGLLD